MYNEEDDTIVRPATDVFEINDFTAATEWENFIDDIENVLRYLWVVGWWISQFIESNIDNQENLLLTDLPYVI